MNQENIRNVRFLKNRVWIFKKNGKDPNTIRGFSLKKDCSFEKKIWSPPNNKIQKIFFEKRFPLFFPKRKIESLRKNFMAELDSK